VSLRSELFVAMSKNNVRFVRLYFQLFVGGLMSYLRYCIVFFVLLSSSCCQLRRSLDCPFLIAPSVFSNVYLLQANHILLRVIQGNRLLKFNIMRLN
jgi:hypothetical protein